MSNTTQFLRDYHTQQRPHFASAGQRREHEQKIASIYRSLDSREICELVLWAVDMYDHLMMTGSQDVLRCLASFHPGRLCEFHGLFVEESILYPGHIFVGGKSTTAERLLSLIGNTAYRQYHLLAALAWIGNGVVQKAFNQWKEQRSQIDDRLTLLAGWELTAEGRKHDLFHTTCYPLQLAGREVQHCNTVRIVTDEKAQCPACGRQLIVLFDFDTQTTELEFLKIVEDRLRIITCDFCSCKQTLFFHTSMQGQFVWHPANTLPATHYPRAATSPRIPNECLVVERSTRHWLEATDQLIPGIRFSQIGGLPTWVQDPDYPRCPECQKLMMFIGQLALPDIDFGDEFFYAFYCHACSVSAALAQST